jgi:uncharacterized membrane protein YoaK (UPF0700 family)
MQIPGSGISQPRGNGGLSWQERRGFLIGLTAAAGWLDALAFLYLGKVFISFMSGNVLFVGIGIGGGDGGRAVRAAAVLAAFLAGAAAGARLTGSRIVPGARSPLGRTLLLELGLLATFAVLWLVAGDPARHTAEAFALLVVGSGAMGLQAAIALAFHLPNVATVAITATLAQLAALVGWREREGREVVAKTPSASLMAAVCLAYVIGAAIVAAVPDSSVLAFGPVLLLASGIAIDARRPPVGSAYRPIAGSARG